MDHLERALRLKTGRPRRRGVRVFAAGDRLPAAPLRCAPLRAKLLTGLLVIAALAGCGKDIEVPAADTRMREGAVLFNDRCSGCHSLDAAASVGSKPPGKAKGGERTNGPNFNARKLKKDDALFAIRNGGFSGAVMPANIVVGDDAEKVAEFLEKYAGKDG